MLQVYLCRKDGLTYAALILLSEDSILQQYLSCSELF